MNLDLIEKEIQDYMDLATYLKDVLLELVIKKPRNLFLGFLIKETSMNKI